MLNAEDIGPICCWHGMIISLTSIANTPIITQSEPLVSGTEIGTHNRPMTIDKSAEGVLIRLRLYGVHV